MYSDEKARSSLRRLKAEIILSNVMMSIAIMNIFWREYAGMDQWEVSISQAAFMIVMIVLDVPMGWLADTFSRKWANIVGDAVYGLGFIAYAFADSLWTVIFAEIVLAIGLSTSSGADGPLMEEYCKKLRKDYASEEAKLQVWGPIAMGAGMVLGGMIGSIDVQYAVLLSGVTPLIGMLAMLGTVETPRPRQVTTRHPIKDMKAVIHYSLRGHKELAATIWAKTVLNASTHTLVWVTTPILLVSGVAPWLVGVGWALSKLGTSIGAMIASRWGIAMHTQRAFIIPLLVVIGGCTFIGLVQEWYSTIAIVICFGAVLGWQLAIMRPRVQLLSPEIIKSSVNSVSSTLSRLLYIPLVMIVGHLGQETPQHALLGNAIIFTLLGVSALPMLRKHT